MKIKGKIALVAGGTRGIGLAIARRLAAGGARLIIPTYDWPQDVQAVQEEFSRHGAGHLFLKTDLRVPREVARLVETAGKACGCIHILINNIERGGMPIVHGSYDRPVNDGQWQLEMDTTLLAKRHLFEHCLPLLRKAGEAAVVNISSIAAVVGRAGPAGLIFSDGYSAANRGVSSLTATWARIGAPGIRVNEIMLGLLDTRHGKKTRGWNSLDKQQRQALIEHTLLGRTGTPAEAARAALFLIQDADYMTGSVLLLDGGYVLGGETVPPMPPGEI
ncbi:MAG: SDR family NAD(P)-dependent oxidoreductase [Desulfobulbaceae bacterium]|nr:SDR family NAD(P)-dependent oxidoreductase [Desulfobulbaceae bacterium]